jgi:hypothetical protein
MSDVRSAEFERAFIVDCTLHGKRTFPVELDLATAVVVIGQLQLALRHPGNVGESAKIARDVATQLIDHVACTDVIRHGLEAGFDPNCDVPMTPRSGQ